MNTIIFISLPMRDLPEAEIKSNQQAVFNNYKARHPNETCHLINPFNESEPHQTEIVDFIGHPAVKMLGESIATMSYADVVIFARDWEKYPGCSIEHKVCTYYNLKVIYD